MGLQHASVEFSFYNGPDWSGVFEAMAAAGAPALGSRPGHGFYNDHRPREMIEKACLIARQVARLPVGVDFVCPEVENFTHVAMGKTAHGTAVESTLGLAMGCNALSYAIICSGHESLEWYGRTMLATLSAWRPFWRRYLDATRGTQPGGLNVACGREPPGRAVRSDQPPFAWASVNPNRVCQLATMGLALCCESPAACGAILCGEAVDGMSDEEIRAVLTGGVVLDGPAAERIAQRGLGGLLGVDVEPFGPLDSHEVLTDDPANGQFGAACPPGSEWWVFFAGESSPIYRLTPRSDRVRVLGRYVDAKGQAGAAATVLAENDLGGRVAIFAFDGFSTAVSSAKRWQMLAAADWVSGGAALRLPVLIETAAQVMVVPRVDSSGRLRAVMLLNASIERTGPLTVRLRRPMGSRSTWIQPTGPDVALPGQVADEEAVVQVPPIGPWSIGYVVLE
jgi:hypothetical protein